MSSAVGTALVVEDDPSWQQILSEIARDHELEIDLAADIESASGHLRARGHRLAIVDLSLSANDHNNTDGLRVLDAIRQLNPDCRAILLTGYSTVELAVSALTDHCAYTFLRKETFQRRQFREIIERILQEPPSELGALSSREREVLDLLAQGLTNKEIADQLFITTNTVKRHLKAIFEKLGVHTRSAAASKAVSK